MKAKRKPSPPDPQAALTPEQRAGVLPLDYMLAVIRDPKADVVRKDRLAIAAAPYCHGRIAEVGKKQQQKEAAKKAGGDDSGWADDLDYSDGELRQ